MSDQSPRNGAKRLPPKPVQTPAAPGGGSSDLKSHPVLVIGGVFCATVLGCMALFNGIVLPNHSAKQDNEIQSLKLKLAVADKKLKNAEAKLLADRERASSLEKQVERLSRFLSEARLAGTFSPANPYPNGFASVKIGMPISEVRRLYPAKAIDARNEKDGHLSVNFANSPVSMATYYFDEDLPAESQVISHVLFFWGKLFTPSKPDLVKMLTETFGAPIVVDEYRAWSASSKENIFVDDKDSYVVMDKDSRPNNWPQEKELALMAKAMSCPIATKK